MSLLSLANTENLKNGHARLLQAQISWPLVRGAYISLVLNFYSSGAVFRVRFARIHRLFTTYDQTLHPPTRHWAHVQWFDHGTMTDLGEMAAPNELFETYNCNNIGLASIKQLITLQMVKCESGKILPLSDTHAEDHFFCR